MANLREDFAKGRVKKIYAPWEKHFDKILTPFERFVKHQATAGLLLMVTAFIALVLANTPLGDIYRHMLHTPLGFSLGEMTLEKTLHHWVNDGLMVLFFFMVGLELKREILVGELANLRMALLPVIAAIGGMLVPALIYFCINPSGDAMRGWGIPMATDIAFALGVIALLAGRVPHALISFLVALAIVDDLGAILIIALFYTEELNLTALFIGGVTTLLMISLNFLGVRRTLPYFMLGFILWAALLKSGVHATLAGVIAAFCIPALPKFDPLSFTQRMRQLLDKFDDSYQKEPSILKNQNMVSMTQSMGKGVAGVEAPLQRMELSMHLPVAFLVLPVFALFNAGIAMDFSSIHQTLAEPVVMGVSLGLLLGKFIGIAGFSTLALKMKLVSLPYGVTLKHIIGASLLASIGFTMSIFIAELAFAHQPALLIQAKIGILSASLLAGVVGYLWLFKLGSKTK